MTKFLKLSHYALFLPFLNIQKHKNNPVSLYLRGLTINNILLFFFDIYIFYIISFTIKTPIYQRL
nr:MAG TPA_asm: hypothetical protein [Bacteriophage sp.]